MNLKGTEHIKTIIRAFFPNCEFENREECHNTRCCQGFKYLGTIWNKRYHGIDLLLSRSVEYNTEEMVVDLMKKFKRGEA